MAGCYPFESIRPAASTAKPRPRWLKALGSQSLPETVAIGGVPHRLRETFKHDSWAATGLYEGAAGNDARRQAAPAGTGRRHPDGLAGATDGSARDPSCSSCLADLKGLPALAGQVSVDGRQLGNAVARDYIEGHPLGNREDVKRLILPALEALLRAMHDAKNRLRRPAQARKHFGQ